MSIFDKFKKKPVVADPRVTGAVDAFDKRARALASSDAWQKMLVKVRKDMMSDAEVGIFLFTQSAMQLHKHLGDEEKALNAIAELVKGAQQSVRGGSR